MRTTSRRDERPPTGNTSGPTIHSRHVQLCVRDKLITAKMTAKKQRVAAEECDAALEMQIRCKTMHRRDAWARCSQCYPVAFARARATPYALQAARMQRRRAAAPTHGIFGTHKRTTCGARMQRDMPLPRLLRNTLGAARGRSQPCRAVLVGPDGRVDATHNSSREKHNPRKPLTKKRTGASSSSRPSP